MAQVKPSDADSPSGRLKDDTASEAVAKLPTLPFPLSILFTILYPIFGETKTAHEKRQFYYLFLKTHLVLSRRGSYTHILSVTLIVFLLLIAWDKYLGNAVPVTVYGSLISMGMLGTANAAVLVMEEKDQNLQAMLQIYGVKKSLYWRSYACFFLILTAGNALFGVLILSTIGRNVFAGNNYFLIFMMFWLAQINVLAFLCSLSCCIDSLMTFTIVQLMLYLLIVIGPPIYQATLAADPEWISKRYDHTIEFRREICGDNVSNWTILDGSGSNHVNNKSQIDASSSTASSSSSSSQLSSTKDPIFYPPQPGPASQPSLRVRQNQVVQLKEFDKPGDPCYTGLQRGVNNSDQMSQEDGKWKFLRFFIGAIIPSWVFFNDFVEGLLASYPIRENNFTKRIRVYSLSFSQQEIRDHHGIDTIREGGKSYIDENLLLYPHFFPFALQFLAITICTMIYCKSTFVLDRWFSIGYSDSESGSKSAGNNNEDSEKQHILNDESNQDLPLKLTNLRKEFNNGKQVANDDLNFYVKPGEIFGLLGHNGAGKSTLINQLTGMIPPTSGNATVCGFSINTQMENVRQRLSVCPQTNPLWGNFTLREHLMFFAAFRGLGAGGDDHEDNSSEEIAMKKITIDLERYAKALGLTEKLDTTTCAGLSGGQQRRLWVATALLGKTQLILLDEPTSGMDPESRRDFWVLLRDISKQDKRAIVFSTHYLEEADLLADRKVILARGRVAAEGTSLELKRKHGAGYWLTIVLDSSQKQYDKNSEEKAFNVIQKWIATEVNDTKNDSNLPKMVNPSRGAVSLTRRFCLPWSCAPKLASLLERLSDELDGKNQFEIRDYSLEITSLEEVFMTIGEEADKEIQQDLKQKEAIDFTHKGQKFLEETGSNGDHSGKVERKLITQSFGDVLIPQVKAMFWLRLLELQNLRSVGLFIFPLVFQSLVALRVPSVVNLNPVRKYVPAAPAFHYQHWIEGDLDQSEKDKFSRPIGTGSLKQLNMLLHQRCDNTRFSATQSQANDSKVTTESKEKSESKSKDNEALMINSYSNNEFYSSKHYDPNQLLSKCTDEIGEVSVILSNPSQQAYVTNGLPILWVTTLLVTLTCFLWFLLEDIASGAKKLAFLHGLRSSSYFIGCFLAHYIILVLVYGFQAFVLFTFAGVPFTGGGGENGLDRQAVIPPLIVHVFLTPIGVILFYYTILEIFSKSQSKTPTSGKSGSKVSAFNWLLLIHLIFIPVLQEVCCQQQWGYMKNPKSTPIGMDVKSKTGNVPNQLYSPETRWSSNFKAILVVCTIMPPIQLLELYRQALNLAVSRKILNVFHKLVVASQKLPESDMKNLDSIQSGSSQTVSTATTGSLIDDRPLKHAKVCDALTQMRDGIVNKKPIHGSVIHLESLEFFDFGLAGTTILGAITSIIFWGICLCYITPKEKSTSSTESNNKKVDQEKSPHADQISLKIKASDADPKSEDVEESANIRLAKNTKGYNSIQDAEEVSVEIDMINQANNSISRSNNSTKNLIKRRSSRASSVNALPDVYHQLDPEVDNENSLLNAIQNGNQLWYKKNLNPSKKDTDIPQPDELDNIVLATKDIHYCYRSDRPTELPDFWAVNGVSVAIRRGECFGLLGPNGAGKTTTFSLMSGVDAFGGPTSGQILYNVYNAETIKELYGIDKLSNNDQTLLDPIMKPILESQSSHVLGTTPQFDWLWPHLTAVDHLRFYSKITGTYRTESDSSSNSGTVTAANESGEARVFRYLAEVGLNDRDACTKPTSALSGGMKRKVSVALNLITAPSVSFLDEMSAGVDAVAQRNLWEKLLRRDRSRQSLLITSHSMAETEACCGRIGILVKGKIRCLGTPLEIKHRYGRGYELELHLRWDKLDDSVSSNFSIEKYVLNSLRKSFAEDSSSTSIGGLRGDLKVIEKMPMSDIRCKLVIALGAERRDRLAKTLRWCLDCPLSKVGNTNGKVGNTNGTDSNDVRVLIDDYCIGEPTLESIFLNFARLQGGS